ncbi:MAG TPA: LacI family DNA-binding transcriptional regulator, partial [Candidatus Synoicihabitans sp.]|nr:LacI family DNA-binding transcriptional regulator [Candidatus Synoicihabitans sp.]
MQGGSTPTIKDIARVVRLHYSSVSLALREHPSIPEATRARVRRAARRLGYQANPVMSALSGFRRGRPQTP